MFTRAQFGALGAIVLMLVAGAVFAVLSEWRGFAITGLLLVALIGYLVVASRSALTRLSARSLELLRRTDALGQRLASTKHACDESNALLREQGQTLTFTVERVEFAERRFLGVLESLRMAIDSRWREVVEGSVGFSPDVDGNSTTSLGDDDLELSADEDLGGPNDSLGARTDEAVVALEGVLKQQIASLEQILSAHESNTDEVTHTLISRVLGEFSQVLEERMRTVARTQGDIQHGIQLLIDGRDEAKDREDSMLSSVSRGVSDLYALSEEVLTRITDQRLGLETQRSVYLTAVDAIGSLNRGLADHRSAMESLLRGINESLVERVREEAAATRGDIGALAGELPGLRDGVARDVEGLIEQASSASAREIEAAHLRMIVGSVESARDAVVEHSTHSAEHIIGEVSKAIAKPNHRQRCDLVNEVRAMHALVGRYALAAPAPRLSPSSMDATSIEALTRLIEKRSPRVVLECGSGISTVWIAHALQVNGGEFRSLDHLSQYGEQTRAELSSQEVAEEVDLRIAPLEKFALGGNSFEWYGSSGWSDLQEIDLLVVDGPPSTTGKMARYPALPLLASRLVDGALIAIDDATREDEELAVAEWMREYPGLTRLGRPSPRLLILQWRVQH